MLPKQKIVLFIFFIFYSSFIFTPLQSQQSLYELFQSFFRGPVKKSKIQTALTKAAASGKPLDLQALYQEKEEKDTFSNPIKAADTFKKVIEEAAKKGGVMARFKNHPEKFLFGASSSSYQYEGGLDEENANALFYKKKGFKTAGYAIDFWNRYETDIAQMKDELGINCFRLSIAWERIQPHQNRWRKKSIEKYVTIIKKLKEFGIEPIVVLHHYTIPQWFAEIGGFEKAENIKYFVEFAKKMYEALHEHVTYWSTFNAIEGYAFKGYYKLDGPPGITKSLFTTEKVMYNMLNAHAQVYQAIKGSSSGLFAGLFSEKQGLYQQYKEKNNSIPDPQIGIQKNIVLFDPFSSPEQSFCEKYGSQFICSFSSLLNNTIFFKLLRYRYRNTLDWIGLNVYSNMIMLYAQPQKETEEERKTENLNYRDYPEGIYRAAKIINDNIARPLNIPIIITENGIATKNDIAGNEKRTRFFKRALYTIRKLIAENYPIIGYTPWSSHDNYEWPSKDQPDPYNRPYGLFYVDFIKPELPRTLKEGAFFYRDFIKEYFKPKTIEKPKTWLE